MQGLDIKSSEDLAKNKIEPGYLFSYTPWHDTYRTVHCTKHVCTPCWHGGRFFLSRHDGGNVSLRVSDRIYLASIPCLPLHQYCRSFPLSSPFSPVALVAVFHMLACAAEAFTFLGSLSERFPWLRHIRFGIEQILRPIIPFWGNSVSDFPALAAVYVIGIPIFLLARTWVWGALWS